MAHHLSGNDPAMGSDPNRSMTGTPKEEPVTVHHYFYLPPAHPPSPDPRLDELLVITSALLKAVRNLERGAKRMNKEVQDLTAAVEEQGTIEDGLKVAVTGITQKIDELLSTIEAGKEDPVSVMAAVQKLRANNESLRSNVAVLSAALVAGTSSAPTEPAPVTEPLPEL